MRPGMGTPLSHWLAAFVMLACAIALGWRLSTAQTRTTGPTAVKKQPTLATAASSPPAPPGPSATLKADESQPVDIFAVRSWEPPPPPVDTRPVPPPPPQAPPLPFKLLGRIADPSLGTAYLLQRGEDVLTVAVGDDIDGIYHVEKLDGGQLQFIYQPLHIRQSLAVGTDP